MSPNPVALVELFLVLGIVMGLAAWQLLSLRRERRASGPPEEPACPDPSA